MEIIEEFDNKLVCDKGNMLLYSYLKDNIKTYKLLFAINNIDTSKINLENFLSLNIWKLIDKINPDLIEKIHIMKVYNDNDADILILLKQIAKDIGMKQKYIIFNTKRKLDNINNRIIFINKDLNLVDNNKMKEYLKSINININRYEKIVYNFGIIKISLSNINITELEDKNNKTNKTNIINSKFETDFQLIINDNLPIYMENLIGLIIKKIFYNLKVFIDNLE
tara:strand:- start:961 stop:1632 length:672 start_codon:yes stop_codon:yes gene_type:complete